MSTEQGTYVGFDGRRTYVLRIDFSGAGTPGLPKLSGDIFNGNVGEQIFTFRSATFRASFSSGSVEEVDGLGLTARLTVRGRLKRFDADPPTYEWVETGKIVIKPASSSLGIDVALSVEGSRRLSGEYSFRVKKVEQALRVVLVETDRVAATNAELDELDRLAKEASKTIGSRGIEIVTSTGSSIVPDQQDMEWEERDLRNAMENHFLNFRSSRRAWLAYMLLAPKFARNTAKTYGIMFDNSAEDENHRQGAAVFWRALMDEYGPDYDRDFQRTFYHELGHMFNLIHTFEDSRSRAANSLSAMNYPERFAKGAEAYREKFAFDLDDVEREFLFHGHYEQVVMGGFRFSGSNYYEEEPTFLETDIAHDWMRLEIRLPRGRTAEHVSNKETPARKEAPVFRFGEPVAIEVKLSTAHVERLELPDVLAPSHRCVRYLISKPNGETVNFAPRLARCGQRREKTVSPECPQIYERVCLSYGSGGNPFAEPGRYRIQAQMKTPDGGTIVSNTLVVSIQFPSEAENDVLDLIHFTFDGQGAAYLYHWGDHTMTTVQEAFKAMEVRLTKHPLIDEYHRCRDLSLIDGVVTIDRDAGRATRSQAADLKEDPVVMLRGLLGLTKGLEADKRPHIHCRFDNMILGSLASALVRQLSKEADVEKAIASCGDCLSSRGVGDRVLSRVKNSWHPDAQDAP